MLSIKLRLALVFIVGLNGASNPSAQVDSAEFRFEVVSVKPNKDPSGRSRTDVVGDRFTALRIALQDLVRMAYPFQESVRTNEQIIGGPDWIKSERFDVVATMDRRRTPGVQLSETEELNQVRAMLRAALADRFKLVLHHETRQLPVYVLTTLRTDGRLGPKLRRVDIDCSVGVDASSQATRFAACGGFASSAAGMTAHAVTITMLVNMLSSMPVVGRIVEDRTGFQGLFDLDLEYSNAPSPSPGTPDFAGPSIFTALGEQLGLKLEPGRGPVDVLVIDSAERPQPD